jgi:hypothetical protein
VNRATFSDDKLSGLTSKSLVPEEKRCESLASENVARFN